MSSLPKPLYRVELISENNEHRYTIDQDPTFHPGVTGILGMANKPFIDQWIAKETALYMEKKIKKVPYDLIQCIDWELWIKRSKKQHRFLKESAGRKGTEAHNIFDMCIKTELALKALSDRWKNVPVETTVPCMKSFNHWMKNNPLHIVAGDTTVASKIYGYGGSIDAAGLDEEGKIVVIDFKTSKNIWDSHGWQVASYSYAMRETYGLDYYPEAYIIRFDHEKPQFERRKIRDVHDSFKAFKACLDLYHAMKMVHFENRETVKEKPIKKEKSNARRIVPA